MLWWRLVGNLGPRITCFLSLFPLLTRSCLRAGQGGVRRGRWSSSPSGGQHGPGTQLSQVTVQDCSVFKESSSPQPTVRDETAQGGGKWRVCPAGTDTEEREGNQPAAGGIWGPVRGSADQGYFWGKLLHLCKPQFCHL